MGTTPYPPRRTAVSPDERSEGLRAADTQSPGKDIPSHEDSTHKPDDASAVTGAFDRSHRPGMPPLADHTLTDTHSCTRCWTLFLTNWS